MRIIIQELSLVKAIVSTASSSLTPTNVTYDPSTGDSQFTFGGPLI